MEWERERGGVREEEEDRGEEGLERRRRGREEGLERRRRRGGERGKWAMRCTEE